MEKRRRCLEQEYPVWQKMTLYERFVSVKKQYSDYPFFIDKRVHSYREVSAAVSSTIECLKKQGIKKEDRVVVALANRVEFLYLTFALAAVGAVKIPINPNLGSAELVYIIEQSKPKLLIVEHARMAEAIRKRIPSLVIICMDQKPGMEQVYIQWKTFFDEAMSDVGCQSAEDRQEEECSPDNISDIIYTSGSTGNPKGVLLTHDMLLRSAYASCLNRGLEFGWRCYVPLPLFHVYGYVEGLMAVLLVRGSLVVTEGKYQADKAIQAISDWEADDILSVPFIMAGILKSDRLQEEGLPSLRAVYCSACICPDWIWKAVREKLGVEEITTGYGMTEVCGATVQNPPEESKKLPQGCLGKILSGGCAGEDGVIADYRVVSLETGEELPAGKSGELVCRGPVVTKGYLNERKANIRVFDANGWFHTGDIGYFTEDGFLMLEGRKNDSYRMNGENVSPHFLDSVISRCPEVAMVETVGVPDTKVGNVGAAFIEPISYKEETLEKIKKYCQEELASYQIPSYFFFEESSSWDKTSSGKFQKKRLREIAVEKIKHIKER